MALISRRGFLRLSGDDRCLAGRRGDGYAAERMRPRTTWPGLRCTRPCGASRCGQGRYNGWKDTVLVMPGERVKLLLKFEDYPGMYLYHCHNLEHEDQGMMRNLLVQA